MDVLGQQLGLEASVWQSWWQQKEKDFDFPPEKKEFAAAQPGKVEPIVGMLAQTSPQGYAANCAAVRDADYREQLGAIKAPTLIICGSHDAVTTPEHGRFMQERIQGAELVEFHAAHLSSVEAGDAFSQAVLAFLRK